MLPQTLSLMVFGLIVASTSSSFLKRVTNPFDYNGKQKEGRLVLRCFDRITNEMADTFESFIVYSDTPDMCVIFLPENVEVNYIQLNFTNPLTYTRVLAGAAKKKLTYRYAPVYATNGTMDYGIFAVNCPFGVVAFRSFDPIWDESIEFALNNTHDTTPWSISCPDIDI